MVVTLPISILISFIIPFFWGLIVFFLRLLIVNQQPLTERVEKIFLMLMVLPGMVAPLVIGVGHFLPVSMPVLLLGDGLGGITELSVVEVDIPTRDQGNNWLGWFCTSLWVIYGAGLALGLWRLQKAFTKIRATIAAGKAGRTSCGREVIITPFRGSPFVSMRGNIILPSILVDRMAPDQIDLILHHEEQHRRRYDPLWFAVLSWLDIVFWYSPIVRRQTDQCRLCAEMECDFAVIKAAPAMRKAYAQSLLQALRHTAGTTRSNVAMACAPAVFSQRNKGDYRMRITAIMQNPEKRGKPLARLGLLGVVILATMAVLVMMMQLSYAQVAGNGDAIFTVSPLEGRISSRYGQRKDPFTGKMRQHIGLDIVANEGAEIVAPGPGKVVRILKNYKGYGNLLEIAHGPKFITRYGQLSAFEVKLGERIRAGQTIARVGSTGRSTGPHLHLEVLKNGEHVDPEMFLPIRAHRK